MLDRLKKAARQKLQRAVAEVVEAELARRQQELDRQLDQRQQQLRDMHSENMAALDRMGERIVEQGDRLHHRLYDLEQIARRDILHSQDTAAANDSAAFVLEQMPTASVFWHPHDTLRYALGEIKGPGLALEFGVATGTTLKIIADAVLSDRTVVGFDVFTGLPETWRTGFPAGEFAQQEVPDIPGAQLIVGMFEDELPGFLARNEEQITFVHVDCDLYSSTKTILDLTGNRLAPDAVLVFDEFFNYPGWQQHEYRAWREFIEQSGRTFEYLAYTGNNEQVVVRLH
ncbi:MAG: class I SAM-dependent methyltransferase [Mycobacterium sp.]